VFSSQILQAFQSCKCCLDQ